MRRENFFVGGSYVGSPEAQVMHGQMYAEVLTPERVTRPYPLVLIHGRSQTAISWMTTPDGRQGWAEWFAGQGWQVCMIDQVARGRSAWQPEVDGAVQSVSVSWVEEHLTATAAAALWPQARHQTQWPGSGRAGDPVFDQFYAGQVPSLANPESEMLMQAAGAALLDRIGPAVLLTHSQGGLFGWLIADARPNLVKGIVALEPSGPPYLDSLFQSGTDRPAGLTTLPLTYDPPVTADDPLAFERQLEADAPELEPCWAQKGKPRRLKNLAGIPVLVATAQASYHAVYDHCTAHYLQQAGVDATFARLEDHGFTGNGHLVMLERNSLEIAAFLDAWLADNVG